MSDEIVSGGEEMEPTQAEVSATRLKKATVDEILDNDSVVGLRWTFSNGDVREIHEADVAKLKNEYFWHGVRAKHQGCYASDKSVEDAVFSFDSLLDQAKAGDWFKVREGGGSSQGGSVLARALVEYTGRSIEEIRAIINGFSPEERAVTKNLPEVAAIIKRLEAEALAKKSEKVDQRALMEKLGLSPR